MNSHFRPCADRNEIDLLVHYIQVVVRSDSVSDWERKFCASILKQSRRTNFSPSGKQISIMRRIVDRFKSDKLGEGAA